MYEKYLFLILALFLIDFDPSSGQKLSRFEFESPHMGTNFQIILYTEDDSLAKIASDAVFDRIDELESILSDYREDSELSRLSAASGSERAVKVSEPLFYLLKRSVEISKETHGYFDITIGPYTQLWREMRREPCPQLPDESELKIAGKSVGYRSVILNKENQTVKLLHKGMRLDPGGIGKGYTSDEALKVLHGYGINIALINAGGDISAGQPPPGKEGWDIAIPLYNKDGEIDYHRFKIAGEAINTSGNLFQFVEIDGEKYSHIIHPKTGLGITDQIQVSVISANGTDADAFATALSVMGFRKAKNFIESKQNFEALIQTTQNGETDVWFSDNFGDQ